MTLWVDGSLVAEDAAVIRANDHGLVVGDGVFETCKVVDGEVFALSRHLRRLRTSATGLGLRYDESAVRAGVAAVTAGLVGLSRLRITVTGGPAPYGSGRGEASPSLLVASVPCARLGRHRCRRGRPVDPQRALGHRRLKTTSYAENVVALARAVRSGRQRGDPRQHRRRAVRGHRQQRVRRDRWSASSPRRWTAAAWPGITRELILEWLGDVVERAAADLGAGRRDEAFLASSTRDVQPIRSVDGRALPAAPGPLTTRAIDVFADRSKEIDP